MAAAQRDFARPFYSAAFFVTLTLVTLKLVQAHFPGTRNRQRRAAAWLMALQLATWLTVGHWTTGDYFAVNRDQLDKVVEYVKVEFPTFVHDGQHQYMDLPPNLRFLSSTGDIYVEEGRILVPLYSEFFEAPDGLVYSPNRKPDGWFGPQSLCLGASELGDGWYNCANAWSGLLWP